ncbi:MAG: methylated-DNA--[Firmicutes bacterium]|nr:methylated-DNA--[protein]-cysteine S-methyltransferase [Bacillota bacterium]
MYNYIKYKSPIGNIIVAEEGGKLIALVFNNQKYEKEHLAGEGTEKETPILKKTRTWLDKYFAGKNPDVSKLPLNPAGTDFQKKVWKQLEKIPYGKTVTYGDIAKKIKSTPRAVGSAVGRNPISIIIPCHRVIGADGSLTGYAGGVPKKKKLLKLECID